MTKQALAYRQVNIQTAVEGASPHRLTQMLMEGALQRLAAAKGAIQHIKESKDNTESRVTTLSLKGESIGRAISIIGELRGSLNKDAGGNIAGGLDDLYGYMIGQLSVANLQNGEQEVGEVIELMTTIKSAWDGIADEVA